MSRKLQITAISAEDLVDGRDRVKKNAFVVFDFSGDDRKQPMAMRTSLDEVGGNYPMWEDKLESEVSSGKTEPTSMYVEVYGTTSSGKDKHVGTARVPVKVFTGGYAPEGFLHCLSYRLWDEYGRRNGIVNFSVRNVPHNKASGFSGKKEDIIKPRFSEAIHLSTKGRAIWEGTISQCK